MKDNYISKETCTMIRAIVAIMIVLHHLSGYISFAVPLKLIFRNIGALMATVFFFYSGYGLIYSLKNKPDYMKSFLRKRVSSVLIPYIIANIVYIVYLLLVGEFHGIAYYADKMSRGYTLLPYSWYVIAIIILYFLFYISFRWLDMKKGAIVCAILNIGYMLVLYAVGYGEWWYNTSFAFVFGIIFALYYDKFNEFLCNKIRLKFICFALLFLALLAAGKLLTNALILMAIKAIRAVVFCICMLYFSMLLKRRFAPLEFLGRLSFEIYLYQGLAIGICWKLFQDNGVVLVCAVLILTVFIAYAANKIDNKAKNTINKKKPAGNGLLRE